MYLGCAFRHRLTDDNQDTSAPQMLISAFCTICQGEFKDLKIANFSMAYC